mmetsp:Transcript_93579/g.267746  ORF Transcript_93579/g.267746 Transcript_93579/m.267746 type:complete len:201 (-) Transcript_93579:778-1380(-)
MAFSYRCIACRWLPRFASTPAHACMTKVFFGDERRPREKRAVALSRCPSLDSITPHAWYVAALRGLASIERWKSTLASWCLPEELSSAAQHCQPKYDSGSASTALLKQSRASSRRRSLFSSRPRAIQLAAWSVFHLVASMYSSIARGRLFCRSSNTPKACRRCELPGHVRSDWRKTSRARAGLLSTSLSCRARASHARPS